MMTLGSQEITEELYDLIYQDAYVHIYRKIYSDLNTHIQLLANEHGITYQQHKYPCMSLSIFVRKLREKYGIPTPQLELEHDPR